MNTTPNSSNGTQSRRVNDRETLPHADLSLPSHPDDARDDVRQPDEPAQWLSVGDRRLMPRSFELSDKERKRLHLFARTIALGDDAVARIRAIGQTLFNATHSPAEKELQAKIVAHQRHLERVGSERAALERERCKISPTVEEEQDKPVMPDRFTVKWWLFWGLSVAALLSASAGVSQIVSVALPQIQSVFRALVIAITWPLLAIALKHAVQRMSGRTRQVTQWSMGFVGVAGAALWLWGLRESYTGGTNFREIADTGMVSLTNSKQFVGQLLAELAICFACINAMAGLLTWLRTVVLNDNYRRVVDRIADLDREVEALLLRRAESEGHLSALSASREALVEEGLAVLRVRQQREQLLRENQDLLRLLTP